MTIVCFVKNTSGRYVSFECSGHSGYACEGEDIVCAAVSAATELVITILEKMSFGFELKTEPENAHVTCVFSEADNGVYDGAALSAVIDGYLEYINNVSLEYPDYLKCIIKEV